MSVEINHVDYSNPDQAADLLMLLDHYARDPMGSNAPLPADVREVLIDELKKRDFFGSAIAYVDGNPGALVNFAEGFSTFSAKPLINVHDLVVHSDFRGKGLSHKLLEFVKAEAVNRGCCKLTLEVLSENTVAINSYRKFGFKPYQLTEEGGAAQFWEMKLVQS